MTEEESSKSEGSAGNTTATFEEKVKAEMEKAKDMKVGELKLKLQAKGVLTSTFCEKHEFVRAYAETVVKSADNPTPFGLLGGKDTSNEDDEEEEDDDDDDSPENMVEQLPKYVQRRVEKLKQLHEDRERGMKEYLAERAMLEAKYQALAQPLYQKRADVVSGKFDAEIASGDEDADGTEREKGIPQFWVLTLAHMDVVAELLTQDDIECLESLDNIVCMDEENGEGFTLSFQFAENEFFDNAVLTKKYEIPNLLLGDEPILKRVEGCEIQWKKGKCLTFADVTQKQRGKGKNSGQVRNVVKNEKKDSFFHFFTPPKLPSMESMNEEEAVRLETAFNADYDTAQAFRSHIVPKAFLWYTGHAMDQEMDAAMEGLKWPEGQAPQGDDSPECKQS
jgi:nucleosome assembly protein 1-like 1